jgi:hypothetical protein
MVTATSATRQPYRPCSRVRGTVSSTALKNAYGIDPSSTARPKAIPEPGAPGATRNPTPRPRLGAAPGEHRDAGHLVRPDLLADVQRAGEHPHVRQLLPRRAAVHFEHRAGGRAVHRRVRRRQQRGDPADQLGDPGAGDGRAEEHRMHQRGAGLPAQRRRGVGRAVLDVRGQQRLVVLGQLVQRRPQPGHPGGAGARVGGLLSPCAGRRGPATDFSAIGSSRVPARPNDQQMTHAGGRGQASVTDSNVRASMREPSAVLTVHPHGCRWATAINRAARGRG